MKRISALLLPLAVLFACVNDYPVKGDIGSIVGKWEITTDSRNGPDSSLYLPSWIVTRCCLEFDSNGTFGCRDTFSLRDFNSIHYTQFLSLDGRWEYGADSSITYMEGGKYYTMRFRMVNLEFGMIDGRIGEQRVDTGTGTGNIAFTVYSADNIDVLAFHCKSITTGWSYETPVGIFNRECGGIKR